MIAHGFPELAAGTLFSSVRGGRPGRVLRLLGAGGQGAVYEAELDQGRFALKWYHPYYTRVDLDLRARLDRAIERGAPAESFLWPLDLVEIAGRAEFGYIMPLRQPSFRGMRDLIARPPQRIELRLEQRLKLCARLATSFLGLHASGFCYQDINFGNIFLDPDTVRVLICDNDNVNFDGAQASIYGTRKFMAPEVVRREVLPSTRTDLFSMAVLFFYALIGWHPLDGMREAAIRVLDADAEMSLYGQAPVFIFDPVDSSNGAVAGLHDPLVARWQSLPSGVRRLLLRSFGEGLHEPGKRVLEPEWIAAFAQAQSAVFACDACGFEHVLEHENGLSPVDCAQCGHGMSLPPVLVVGRHLFTATQGRGLPAYVVEGGRQPDFDRLAAIVETHPTLPGVVGLRNLTASPWQAFEPRRPVTSVPPGKAVRLMADLVLTFGQTSGKVLGPKPGTQSAGAAWPSTTAS
jgi:eukaryotic-like serine/threonine-protein kinase